MLNELGVIEIDHVAVVTKSIETTLNDYLSLPGTVLLRGVYRNINQGVYEAFVRVETGTVIEVLMPIDENSPVYKQSLAGGVVHLCWRVHNIEDSIEIALKHGAKLISPASSDVAFGGQRVAFLQHPNHGLFELVENSPSFEVLVTERSNQKLEQFHSLAETSAFSKDNLTNESMLKKILSTVLAIDESRVHNADIDSLDSWDSMAHLTIIMEVEAQYGITVSADRISELASYKDLLAYIEEALK